MSIKQETLRAFLSELFDAVATEGKEPGDVEVVIRGRHKAGYAAETALRKIITLDILPGPPMEVLTKPHFDLTLEGIRIRVEHVQKENETFPRTKAYHEHYHRPVQIHSSQLWNMVQYVRSLDNDREAYVNLLLQYFPSVYTRMFQTPTDKPEQLP